jgi:phosphate transport system protein
MVLYEQRLSEDLQEIRGKVQGICDRVCEALESAVQAIADHDRDTLNRVVMNDYAINRDIRCLDKRCHQFVARHLPAAGHLRFISAVLRLTIALERAGDYAVTISRVVLQLSKPLPTRVTDRISSMSEISLSMMSQATQAFLGGDEALAEETKKLDFRVDRAYDEIFDVLMEEGRELPPRELVSLLKIFSKVERFSDQAKNICEEAVFAASGRMKEPKVFRVLFLDERNDFASQLARAIAHKAFPQSGVYASAGLAPAAELHPALVGVAEDYGFDLSHARPIQVGPLDGFPTEYHVVVAINVEDETRLPRLPYHTILRKWKLDDDPERIEDLVHELSNLIDEMIGILRGADAE